MTRDDIIRMARKAGFMPVTENPHPEGGGWHECFEQDIEYFAALVAAAEREACAKLCERIAADNYGELSGRTIPEACARAIRARGQHG
jgi:hypothetical protein